MNEPHNERDASPPAAVPGDPGPPSTPTALAEVLQRLEQDPEPKDEHDFRTPIRSLATKLQEQGEEVPADVVAEELAFSFHAHDHQGLSSWGLYFGPFMSWTTPSGESIDSPPLSMVTPEVLAYWQTRAAASPHPIMRARYADLLWELPRKLDHARPDAAMARVAIDAYVEAIENVRFEHEVTAVGKARRALDLALSVGDAGRVDRARDVMLALEEQIADDESLGLWGFCFDTFVEPPNKRVPLADNQRERLVQQMEDRLARLAAGPGSGPFHPVGAEAAAMRLAQHYRRNGRAEDMARVLRTYSGAVLRMRESAPPLLQSHSLEQLYDQLMSFGLHEDAHALNEPIRVAGEATLKDMKVVSTSVEIPREQLEEFYEHMLAGTPQEVLLRVAVHFIPRRDEVESELRELASKAPLSYLISHVIKDDDGRTVAHVGSLESDLEGHVLRHASQLMQFGVPWLRETMHRGTAQGRIPIDAMLAFILAAPVFPEKRRALIEAGLRAYERDDSVAAIHILVPQLEQAVRQLATLMGGQIYTQRRGGGLHARTLDDLLRDDAIAGALGQDIVTYLRVLLTDARGWNLRNTVAHGLAPVSTFSMPIADRIVHAMLVLALLRKSGEEKPEEGAAPG